MDEYIFLRDNDNFLWVKSIENYNVLWMEKINLTIRNSKYSVYSQPIYIASTQEVIINTVSVKRNPKLHLYKSSLQKCIRRGLVDESVELFNILYNISPFETVRRMMIIMCEDVLITQEYIYLSWMLSALSKKYTISSYDIERLRTIVYWMASFPYKDYIDNQLKSQIIYNPENNDSQKSNLLKAILLRMGYGGMTNDIKLLEKYYDVWYNRFQNNVDIISPYILEVKVIPVETPVINESVDFHFTNITSYVADRCDFDENYIKKLIWENRSSVNIHRNIVEINYDCIMIEPLEIYDIRQKKYGSSNDYKLITHLIDEFTFKYLT